MKLRPLLLVIALLATPAFAQQIVARAGEPQVKRVVVEDDLARIDELRVRGITTRITVKPKGGNAAAYEIIPPDPAGRDDSFGPRSARGASGQRVWNVFNF